jgi:hypothetical protein
MITTYLKTGWRSTTIKASIIDGFCTKTFRGLAIINTLISQQIEKTYLIILGNFDSYSNNGTPNSLHIDLFR